MGTHRRFVLVWLSVVLVTSIVLCWVPLFNLLAFEYCFVISIPLSIGAGLFGVRLRDGQRLESIDYKAVAYASVAILFGALIPITLNAVRVQNCDYGEGLVIFLFFPLVGLLVSLLWGLALGRLGRRIGSVLWFAVFLLSLLLAAYRFYALLPVDLFNSFLRYYPGALYDDVFLIDKRLIWSRVEDIAIAVLVFAVSAVYSRKQQASSRPMLIALMAMLCAGMTHQLAVKHAVYRDANFIRDALGGHISSKTIELYHPKMVVSVCEQTLNRAGVRLR